MMDDVNITDDNKLFHHNAVHRLRMHEIVWATVLGMPIFRDSLRGKYSWKSVRTTRFPFGFIIICGLIHTLLGAFAYVYLIFKGKEGHALGVIDMLYMMIETFIAGTTWYMIANVLLAGWCYLINRCFAGSAYARTSLAINIQRMICFAAVFHPAIAIFNGIWWAIVVPYLMPIPNIIVYISMIMILLLSALRVAVVLRATYIDTSGSLCITILSVLGCIDSYIYIHYATRFFGGW